MITIQRWTGAEARILREIALRMTIREFADHTGLSQYAIRDFENKGQQAQLRTATQKILDETLAAAPEHAQQRFTTALARGAAVPDSRTGVGATVPLPEPGHPRAAAPVAPSGTASNDPSDTELARRPDILPDLPTSVEGDDVNRRTLLFSAGLAIAAAGLPRPAVDAVGEVAHGLVSHEVSNLDGLVDSPALARAAAGIKRLYQAGDYQEVLAELPGLLVVARTAAAGSLGCEGQQAAADVYQTACSVLLKLGEDGLALLAAERSAAAAGGCGDPVVVGASARALSHALASNGHIGRAVTTALAAARELDQASGLSTSAALAVYGALLLRASVLAAEGEDRATARSVLAEARDTACRLDGGDNTQATYFCTQNVQLHQVSVAVRLGDAGQAIDYARIVDPTQIGLVERQASYFLDMACAFTQWGKHHQAYEALLTAEHTAPQEVALRPAGRELVGELQQRCPPSLHRPVRELANRIGALA